MSEFSLVFAVTAAVSAAYVSWGVYRLYMALGQCPRCHRRLNRAVAICPGCGCRRHEHADQRARVPSAPRRPVTG